VADDSGAATGMLEAYFGMVGWPMFLATSDRPKWCAKVEGASVDSGTPWPWFGKPPRKQSQDSSKIGYLSVCS
jgi:hypothetical protein